jgi:hypothetical protein
MATGPEHYREAEQLASQADEWMDADWGWKAKLTAEERLAYRTADLGAAQVHATLALAAATALIDGKPRSGSFDNYREWAAAAGQPYPPEDTKEKAVASDG